MKVSKPFRNATQLSISQGFHAEHKATDFAGSFGEFLVAPFNSVVTKIRGIESLNSPELMNGEPSIYLRGGCGIGLRSIEDPSITISYWHTLPVFPVREEQTVLQGQVVAQLGNTGWVISGGKIVPYDIRYKEPFPGSHVHVTMGKIEGGTYRDIDYVPLIDWKIPINHDWITATKAILQRISNLLLSK